MEVKDRAIELAIERARRAESFALELEEAMLGMEDHIAETEEALAREQEALARERTEHLSLKRTIAREGAIVQKRLTSSASVSYASASASASASRKTKSFTSMTSDTEGYTSIDDTGDEAKGGAAAGIRRGKKGSVSLREDGERNWGRGRDGDRDRGHESSDYESSVGGSGTPGRARTSSRRPKPLIISENASSGGGSKNGEDKELREPRVKRSQSKLSRADSYAMVRDPVGLKELQASRDSLKRAMRDIMEKAAVLVEAQQGNMPFRFSNGSSSLGRSRKENEEACREVLGTVEAEVNESQEFVDRAEKLLGKMGVLEIRGASAKKKLEARKQRIGELEQKLGLNVSRKKPPQPSCFLPFKMKK